MARIITLTTDFATADGYVGAMKGVIASIAPDCAILDLTHAITPQDVRSAAFALFRSVPHYPDGSIHCAVVDPGVGTERRPLAAKTADGYYLVGPDNGIFSLFCPPFADQLPEAVELTESRWWREGAGPSSTFHGRDIFAPVAAHLARLADQGSVDLSEFGPPVETLHRFDMPVPTEAWDAYWGEVVHVDHFGNAVTNLPERWVEHAGGAVVAEVGGQSMSVVKTYSDVEIGHLCALVGSSGWLEVACREGSAAERLGLAPGIPVILRKVGR